MNKLILLAIGAALLGGGYLWRHPNLAGEVRQLQQLGEGRDGCVGKQRCLVVFVAPWCPTCRAARGFFTSVRARFEESSVVGVKIVVGLDSRQNVEGEAEAYGGVVFADDAHALSERLGVTAVPQLLVLDGRGRLLTRQVGYLPVEEVQLTQLGLDDHSVAKLARR